MPNPGGGADLIEDATLTLVPGHRYGLIGRNGKGKSTLLKFLASRRVGGLDPSLSVHYVSQEVSGAPLATRCLVTALPRCRVDARLGFEWSGAVGNSSRV